MNFPRYHRASAAHDRFSPSLLDEIRARLPVSQVAARKVVLKRAGQELRGLSPLTQEKTPSFFVNNAKQRWFDFSSGQQGDVFDFVTQTEGCSFREAVQQLAREAGIELSAHTEDRRQVREHHLVERDQRRAREERETVEQIVKARWLWEQRQPLAGTIAETYLRNARGCHGPLPPTLGFLPATNKFPPALIAAFAFVDEPEPATIDIRDGAVRAVHLTRLLPDGSDRQRTGEADKLMLGRPKGIPIVLASPGDNLGLAIAEGIEDGLSVSAATNLGTWVAGSASFMPALANAMPEYIECVTIYRHDDEAGRRGADALARGLDARGIEVFLSPAGKRG